MAFGNLLASRLIFMVWGAWRGEERFMKTAVALAANDINILRFLKWEGKANTYSAPTVCQELGHTTVDFLL